ncbi:esterase-like activity of phytase family protein [Confluentibacter flavum]|uniref:Phytase-like domain-containing protein n=1 Tax=Confluentibacter flavum TaxID=1909700 RepID=A0A2N3HIK7_9FLAO|nr:esterase-like activity of phytase family protein [Confluentibacter flavum]PKQ44805.1 hypothetical protein CSW08_11380 [Confluentibacter flavum]
MKNILLVLFALFLVSACENDQAVVSENAVSLSLSKEAKFKSVPPQTVLDYNTQYVLPFELLTTTSEGVEIRNGGYGSATTAHPTKAGEFYALTDRGPNVDYADGKKFPVADYTPRIGHFAITKEGSVVLLNETLFKDPFGNTISGLPNPVGKGATGEIPYDINNNVLPYDDYGLDSEGLVALKDGSFWVSDEYGPHIVNYSAEGIELERISPYGINDGNGGRKLPKVFAKRRANRGMEGLAVTPNEKTLVGIMQSTMFNPSGGAATNRTVTRIVTFDLETGITKQYLYKQEANNLSNSEIVALSDKQFLVVERDGKYSGDGVVQKYIYKIDLEGATDVSGSNVEAELGMLINGKTLEGSSWDEITNAGIQPVKKELVADLAALTGYPHDKLEGLWLINHNTLGCINDDDFAVIDNDGNGVLDQKILPGTGGSIDSSSLYMIHF